MFYNNSSDHREILIQIIVQYSEYNFVPDITQQADNPKVCTQDLDNIDIPREYTKLFKHHIYSVNMSMIPECIKVYQTLGVKHEPLALISPHFETPLPPTQPSVIKYTNKKAT